MSFEHFLSRACSQLTYSPVDKFCCFPYDKRMACACRPRRPAGKPGITDNVACHIQAAHSATACCSVACWAKSRSALTTARAGRAAHGVHGRARRAGAGTGLRCDPQRDLEDPDSHGCGRDSAALGRAAADVGSHLRGST